MAKPLVGIMMGSASDVPVMENAEKALEELGILSEMRVLSAHRTPDEVRAYVKGASGRGIRVLIAGAGMAAHLAGSVSALTDLPVIGVPINSSDFGGLDALLSTVQMPPGVPVASMGVGAAGARNAGLFSARILALTDQSIATRYRAFVQKQKRKVRAADKTLQNKRSSKNANTKRATREKN